MFNIQTDMQMHICGMCSHRGKKNLRFAYGNPSDRRNEGFISLTGVLQAAFAGGASQVTLQVRRDGV